MAKKPSVELGEVFAMPQPGGAWGACQVVRIDGRQVEAVSLDHVGDAQPTLATVTPRALVCERYSLHREVARLHAIDAVPEDFVSLGAFDPVLPAEPASRNYASWEALRDGARGERRWLDLPDDTRRRYRECAASNEQVTLELPSGPLAMARSASTVHLVFGDARGARTTPHAGDGRGFDWRVLDALPCLSRVDVRGDAPGLAAWLTTRPLVNALVWESFSADVLDLRGTRVDHCELRPKRLATLRLPTEFDALILATRAAQPCAVEAADDGAAITLRAEVWARDDLRALSGLRAVRELTVAGFSELDFAHVAVFERVHHLTLLGAPGRVRSGEALARLTSLRSLQTWLCLEVDAVHIPLLTAHPLLTKVRMSGLCEREAEALVARWGNDRRVSLPAPIDDDTLFATADFPLLRWPNNQRKGLVCSGYTAAAKRIVKGELTEADGAKALRAFVTGIQRAVTRTGALTPEERDDVEASWARLHARAMGRGPGAAFPAVKKAW